MGPCGKEDVAIRVSRYSRYCIDSIKILDRSRYYLDTTLSTVAECIVAES